MKAANGAVDELLRNLDRSKLHVIRVMEGFETVMFHSKFDSWPETATTGASDDGRGKVAALLRKQGVNVKGLLKTEDPKEEPQPYVDCSGDLQVWCLDGQEKTLLEASDQSKFYSRDCYIFQYSYSGAEKEEYLIGTWFGKQSVEPRILMAMSRDGLLPSFFSEVSKSTQVPLKSTIVTGVLASLLAFFMDVEQLSGMVSVGTLFAFTMVAISVLILRYVPPEEVPLPSSLQEAIDSNSPGEVDVENTKYAITTEDIAPILVGKGTPVEDPLLEKAVGHFTSELCLMCNYRQNPRTRRRAKV